MEAFVVGAQLMQGERGFGKILELTVGMDLGAAGAELEKFATKLPEAGVRIPRGFRADDSADQGVEPFGAGGG